MGRRKKTLTPAHEALLREVFQMTRGSRADIAEGVPRGLPLLRSSAEAGLARAEEAAIRDFDPVQSMTR